MAIDFEVPCELWTSAEEIRACCDELSEDYDLTGVIYVSSALLFRLSGRRFTGECEEVVRPCATGACGDTWVDRGWGYMRDTQALETWWSTGSPCTHRCGLDCMRLPGPIVSIEEVMLDGVVMDPSLYTTSGRWRVCRRDGTWPCHQDLSLPVSEPDTLQFTYTRGRPIPEDARWMASRLGCELAKGACGSPGCQLPKKTKQITRRGVSIDMGDPISLSQNGLVGLPEVDLWIRSVNPAGIARRARVTRPGRRRRGNRLN